MFRPTRMAWTDLLVDHDAVSDALDVIGRLDIMELRHPGKGEPSFPVALEPDADSMQRLAALDQLFQDMGDHAPAVDPDIPHLPEYRHATETILPQLEQQLRAWFEAAQPVVEQLRAVDTDLEELELLSSCLMAIPDDDLEIGHLSRSTGVCRFSGFMAYGKAKEIRSGDMPGGDLILRTYTMHPDTGDAAVVVVGVCESTQLPELESRMHSGPWRFVKVPPGVEGPASTALRHCHELNHSARRRHTGFSTRLDELNKRYRISSLRQVLQRHLWVNRVLIDARRGQRFVWFSGWVPEARLQELTDCLDSRNIPFLLNSEPPTGHGSPPVQLRNPGWVRRFEAFVHGFGVPEVDEIDPSPVLAVTTPLMFGYMFGDVGHGVVLVLAGLWLQRRSSVLGLLIPAGLASVCFGFLFGSVFCNEHLLPALWLTPLQNPLMILVVPVGFGAFLILLSMAFDAVQESWRGRASDWWALRFPNVLVYLGLMAALLDLRALLVTALGILLPIVIQTLRAARRKRTAAVLSAPFKAGVESLETLLQMIINTISFTRLGAFALAHAGLGMAVVILGDMPENKLLGWMILIAGNVLVIALEGLVVSIQTTRLVMFEFFRRFLAGHGRAFRPLRTPFAVGGVLPGGTADRRVSHPC